MIRIPVFQQTVLFILIDVYCSFRQTSNTFILKLLKKDIDALRQQKALLETELLTSCKESKNKEEERTTMLRIFDGMQEVLGKITSLTNGSAPDQPLKEYTCEICGYKTKTDQDLKKHRVYQHDDNQTFEYSCNICDTKC